jgi:hypothetical protein
MTALSKRCAGTAWVIADPEGIIEDPATLFFKGASDYWGSNFCRAIADGSGKKAGLKTRLKLALAYCDARSAQSPRSSLVKPMQDESAQKANDCVFTGWKAIRSGTIYPFYFLHVSVSAHMNLRTRLGEAAHASFRDKLRSHLQQSLVDADPLLWMEFDATSLYLLPPRAFNSRAAVVACLRLLLGTPLVSYEKLGLPFPISFSFALHYGRSEFAEPGRTGAIVSDSVNFVFHLGSKRAEPGRLVISGEAGREAIPDCLADLFVPGGSFEGRELAESRRFGIK